MNKFMETNKKIEKSVVSVYKNIEKGVVNDYNAVEEAVVDGYKKMEDKFVKSALTSDVEGREDNE